MKKEMEKKSSPKRHAKAGNAKNFSGRPSYQQQADTQVECASEHASGEAVGSDEVANISVRFTGCQFDGAPATTNGLAAGEIQTNTLKGGLGYTNKSHHEVGVLLQPVAPGGLFAEFEVLEGYAIVRVGMGNATAGCVL